MNPLEACEHFPDVAGGPAVPVRGGHIHHTWVVAGRWLVQACNETVFPDLDALMGNVTVVADVEPRLRPFTTASGSSIWRDRSGVAWRARAFIPGRAGTPADAPALGRGLGAFHRRVGDIDPGRLHVHLPGFHDPRRRFAALRDPAELSEFAWILELADRVQAPPARVAHFDAKAENFIVDDRGAVTALVDLDTVMPGSWLWDVGDLVRSTCGTRPEDEPDGMRYDAAVFGQVHDAYAEEIGDVITPGELGAIPLAALVATFEQAVRFLADHQAGDRYYPVERPGHNLDRYRAQLALLDSMADSMRY